LSQTRIQRIAQKKLHMVVPKAKDVVLVEGSANNIVGR
jgi:cell division protein FtsL